ncbi:MAG: hypothetical protein K8Q89_01055 [Nitrosarchaeum sp.]|nr:hypothetical protein [Nitrosarchaeum sp.]
MKELASIYQQIYVTCLDREFETVLINLLEYNSSKYVEIPIRRFLHKYITTREEFWCQFRKCSSFDDAFNLYYQYEKNKCELIDSLWDDLSFALDNGPLRCDLGIIMKDSMTF